MNWSEVIYSSFAVRLSTQLSLFVVVLLYFAALTLFANILQHLTKNHKPKGALLWILRIAPPNLLFLFVAPTITWTNALDSALAKSGIITYPIDSIYGPWLFKFNLVDFFLVGGLNIGLNTSVLTAATVWFMITVSFAAWWLLSSTMTDNGFVKSALATLLTLWNPLMDVFFAVFGWRQPFFGESTYGYIGIALFLAALGLLLTNRLVLAAFVTALLCGVSPSYGAFLLLAVVIAVGHEWKRMPLRHRSLAAVLVAFQILLLAVVPLTKFSSGGVVDQSAFSVYLEVWDSHRAPDVYQIRPIDQLAILAVAILIFVFSKKLWSPRYAYSLRLLAAISLIPLLYWYAIELGGRLKFFQTRADWPLINELFLRNVFISGYLATLVALTLGQFLLGVLRDFVITSSRYRQSMGRFSLLNLPSALYRASSLAVAFTVITFVAIAWNPGFFAHPYAISLSNEITARDTFGNTHDDQSPSRIVSPGLLVPAGKFAIAAPGTSQFAIEKLRLPILLHTENGIDFLPYFPSKAAEVRDAVEEIYGQSWTRELGNRGCGCIPSTPETRDAFESRSANHWRQIARRFSASHVLAPADWRIRAAKIAHPYPEGAALYRIE